MGEGWKCVGEGIREGDEGGVDGGGVQCEGL